MLLRRTNFSIHGPCVLASPYYVQVQYIVRILSQMHRTGLELRGWCSIWLIQQGSLTTHSKLQKGLETQLIGWPRFVAEYHSRETAWPSPLSQYLRGASFPARHPLTAPSSNKRRQLDCRTVWILPTLDMNLRGQSRYAATTVAIPSFNRSLLPNKAIRAGPLHVAIITSTTRPPLAPGRP